MFAKWGGRGGLMRLKPARKHLAIDRSPFTGIGLKVLDTAERWLVQDESQKSGKFLFYPLGQLSAHYTQFQLLTKTDVI